VCPNMDSALAAKIVRPWLDECVSSHDACRSRQRSHLPKRVISVGSHDHAPCLYESHGEESDYIALSYCWGLGRSLTTTKSSYAARVTGISWEDFPNTIRDAMIFTQNIGVQFIWIDALCIIQDDAEDWRVEAAKMASIYENALLTLSATASDSTNSGCFPTPRAKSHKLSKQLPAIQLWTELIQSYSRRLFTYPTDKLVALSGAAQKFQRLDMGLYLAGLWRQDLHVQLCW
ncbi:HET-domain-containing protein, partial [Glonium stellatum]